MIVKSTPVSPKRNRVTVHTSGTLFYISGGSALLEFASDASRIFYVGFDARDLPALKAAVTCLEHEAKMAKKAKKK